MAYLTFKDEIPSLSLCKQFGCSANKLNLNINANPFMRDTDKWKSFNQGWMDALQEQHYCVELNQNKKQSY